MKEDLLHYMWRMKQFALTNLRTTQGQKLEILSFGEYNRVGGGPDFANCLVLIDGIQWAGSVEMHLAASDWYRHGHQHDPRYRNVILHVVLEEDKTVVVDDTRIPCLEVRQLIAPTLVSRYAKLQNFDAWVPCSAHLRNAPPLVVTSLLERMLIERIEGKLRPFVEYIERGQWKRILLTLIGKALGSKANSEPMGELASRISFDDMHRARSLGHRMELLFLGQAGLLNRIFTESYCTDLHVKFTDMSPVLEHRPLNPVIWQTGAVRPANQPALRIVQYSLICERFDSLFETLIRTHDLAEVRSYFAVELPAYWQWHYDLEKPSARKVGTIGSQTVNGILINAVLPFLFLYAKHHHLYDLQSRAMNFFSSLRSENNHVTRQWESIGAPNENAGDSQGLIHLKKTYCDAYRCLECAIGNHILSKSA